MREPIVTMAGLGVTGRAPEFVPGEATALPLESMVKEMLVALVLAPSGPTMLPLEPKLLETALPPVVRPSDPPVPRDALKDCGTGNGGSEPLEKAPTSIGELVAADDAVLVSDPSEPAAATVEPDAGGGVPCMLPVSIVGLGKSEGSPVVGGLIMQDQSCISRIGRYKLTSHVL